jgi:hypothetical protein
MILCENISVEYLCFFCECIRTYVCNVCMYVCMYVCVCVYIYMCVCVLHVYIYIYMHVWYAVISSKLSVRFKYVKIISYLHVHVCIHARMPICEHQIYYEHVLWSFCEEKCQLTREIMYTACLLVCIHTQKVEHVSEICEDRICIYVCQHVDACMYVSMYVCERLHVGILTCMYVRMHVCMLEYMYVY